jgi:hypothetical protein
MNKNKSGILAKEELDLYWNIITNEDLICRHCQNATSATYTCLNYTKHKPATVLYNCCIEYVSIPEAP